MSDPEAGESVANPVTEADRSVAKSETEEDGSADSAWSLFGDPLGLAVFLGALVVAWGTWQVGFFITDTYAVANGLVNLAGGHVTVERIHYSLTLGSQPGLHVVDGRLYARNYGQAVAALPLYYAIEVLATVTRLELLLAGTWSLLVLGACRQVGVVLDRRQPFELAGAVLAVVVFGASLQLARPIDPEMAGIVALQALSVLSVAVLALALYRLCVTLDDDSRRLGVTAGLGAVVATPLWFWAAVPKRHTLIGAAVATLLFWFAASRRTGRRAGVPLAGHVGWVPNRVGKRLALRTMAYALAALVAWVHAFEGVVVLASLAVADLATVSTTTRRALLAVALGVSVGLAPVVATNVAVSGNPVEPPRLTESFEPGGSVELGPGGEVLTGNGGDNETGDTSVGNDGGSVVGVLAERIRSSSVLGYAERLIAEGSNAPTKLYHTYVRSGRIDSITKYSVNDQETIDLSLAESFPLVGTLVGGLFGAILARLRGGRRPRKGAGSRPDGGRADSTAETGRTVGSAVRAVRRLDRRLRASGPARATDGFALLLTAGYATLYFPILPLNTQLTVRYLLPVVPALAYLVACRPAVRSAVDRAGRTLAGSYVVAICIGLILTVATFPALELAVGEAMQLHGLVNLAACGVLVGAVGVTRAGFIDDSRVAAVTLGVTGAATTVLIVRMQLVYFEYGTYSAPVVRVFADALGGAA